MEINAQASDVQTLMDLGLSSVQAKIYFSLARFGPSTVTDVARQVKATRSSTYCTLLKLYELGLIEKTLHPKTKFKAASADQTLKVLKERREVELELFHSKKQGTDGLKKSNGFVVIPHRDQVVKHALRLIKNTRQSLDVIVSWSFFSEFLCEACPDTFNYNVPVNCIIQQPRETRSLELIKKFKLQLTTLRFIPTPPKAMLAIFDKKQVLMIEKPEQNDSPALWTNNPGMLVMAQNYFSSLWQESTLKPAIKKRC